MSFNTLIGALSLPVDARVDQRIPKKLLEEQGAQTAADKKQIHEGIEELRWIAAIKSTNIGVPAFRDVERDYLEIAVLGAVFRQKAKVSRLVELIHRAIPYPVLLVFSFFEANKPRVAVSAAHKRFSQSEAGKFVVDEILSSRISLDAASSATDEFLVSLALDKLPSCDLFTLYQGWMDRLVGLETASISGQFAVPESPEQRQQMQESITKHSQLFDALAALRTQAAKEKQMNRRVELNLTIKRLEAQLAANRSAQHATPFVKALP